MLVWPSSSVTNKPRSLVFRSCSLSVMVVQGPWLMETITLSDGYSSSVSGMSVRVPSSA